MKSHWLLLGALFVGCSSGRWLEAERALKVPPLAPPVAELQELAEKLRLHLDAGRGGCAEARVQAEPAVALELFCQLEDEELRLLIARSWPDASETSLLLASETVRRQQPARHRVLRELLARDPAAARAGFAALTDAIWAARSARAAGEPVSGGLRLQQLYAASQAPIGADARALCAEVLRWRALDAGLQLDGELELAGLRSAELAAWREDLAGLCLEQRRPLEAVRLLARTQPGAAAGLLLARAYLQLGRVDAALDEAALLADVSDPAWGGRAQALAGRALFRLQRLEAAYQAFVRAAGQFADAGLHDAWGRARLNAIQALLLLGRTSEAEQQLSELSGLSAESQRRAAILSALAGCAASGGKRAAAEVRAQLQSAARAGLYALVEDYAGLPDRLEGLP